MQAASSVIQRRRFGPEVSDRIFRVGLTDYALITVIPAFAKQLRREAPNVQLKLVGLDEHVAERLESGELDSAFWGIAPAQKSLKARVLTVERFIGVFWSQHSLAVNFRSELTRHFCQAVTRRFRAWARC